MVRHAYDVLLRLYPEAFRRRYGAEMSFDFADGWAEAKTRGRSSAIRFAGGVLGDLAVSLVREWTRGAHLVIVAATAGITLLLWGFALRPWAWVWSMQPGPPHRNEPNANVTEAQLLMLAAGALIPVLVVLLFATRMVKRREPRARRLF